MGISYLVTTVFELSGTAAMIATFALRVVAAMVIGSIVSRLTAKTPAQGYNRVQLPPNTYNKIPMVYGDAWMNPVVVDARISNDRQWMWYTVVYSENSQLTDQFQMSFIANKSSTSTLSAGTVAGFPDIYWGDRYCYFENPDDGAMVTHWEANHGKETAQKLDQPNNHLWIYNFPNGAYNCENNPGVTAIDIMTDADTGGGINSPWTATNIMNNLCFQIVKVNYNTSAALTGLPTLTSLIHNYQKPTPTASTSTWKSPDPGLVFYDYLTNPVYGAGLSENLVDVASLNALTTYSDQQITFTDYSTNYTVGVTTTTNRYSINGPVDTTQKLLDNLQNLTDCCDSWLTWNETTGKWGVVMNTSSTQVMRIGPDNIYGGITINPIDLNNTYNQVEVTYPNTILKDQQSYYYLDIKTNFKNFGLGIDEPVNKLSMNLNYVNNQAQAAYLAARRLLLSRIDFTITFAMDFSGIQLEAGDVIGIDHDSYGWGLASWGDPGDPNYWYDRTGATTSTGKLFRVQQVVESMKDNVLQTQITAITYDPRIYVDDNLVLEGYRPAANAGLLDARALSQPGTPTTPASSVNPTPEYPNETVPYFVISSATPQGGIISTMELWIGLTNTTPFDTSWKMLDVATGNNGDPIPSSTDLVTNYVNFNISNLQAGTYYFATRCEGVAGYSVFSNFSDNAYTWSPAVSANSSLQATTSTFAQNTFINNAVPLQTYYVTGSDTNAGAYGALNVDTQLAYQTYTTSAKNNLATPNISIAGIASLTPQTVAPTSPTAGTIVMAQGAWGGTTSTAVYPTYYTGSIWKPMIP